MAHSLKSCHIDDTSQGGEVVWGILDNTGSLRCVEFGEVLNLAGIVAYTFGLSDAPRECRIPSSFIYYLNLAVP
jgi:hypothetical protein